MLYSSHTQVGVNLDGEVARNEAVDSCVPSTSGRARDRDRHVGVQTVVLGEEGHLCRVIVVLNIKITIT